MSENEILDDLIPLSEVARMLGRKLQTMANWRRAGILLPPRLAVNKQLKRWSRREVLEWIAAGCPAPATSGK